ncbi:unnamed protein product, partial [marine sediment metagenome]
VLTKSGKTRLAKLGIGLGKIAYGGGVAVAAGTGVNALQDMVGYTDSDGKFNYKDYENWSTRALLDSAGYFALGGLTALEKPQALFTIRISIAHHIL